MQSDEEPQAPPDITLNYSGPAKVSMETLRLRKLAGSDCIVVGSLMLLGGMCVGLVLPSGTGSGLAGLLAGLMLFLMVGSGVTYILGGIRIRKGGRTMVIVCMALALTQCGISLLFTMAGLLISAIKSPGTLIGVIIYGVATLVFGNLSFRLLKIQRIERGP